jgi:hypothetical protein
MSINKYIQINTNNIEYPDNLKQLWNISNGLNLLGCVYNTYGLIIFSIDHISDYKNTLGVFGDMENMNSWYISSNDKPNTVSYYSENSLWLCIGCFNEYDFIFIQVNILNINYGKIKIITNNCCLERFVTIKSNLIDDLYNIYLTDYKY